MTHQNTTPKMKTTNHLWAYAIRPYIILLFGLMMAGTTQRAAADSPLTSTSFGEAYEDVPIVKQQTPEEPTSDKVWAYLANPKNPVDVKMALINTIGWAFEGKNNCQLFLNYLKEKGICKSQRDLYQKRPGDLLLCAAYLKALDNYFEVDEAARMARKAREMHPESYTVNIICALIEAQLAMHEGVNSWGKVYQLTDAVRRNKSLKDDMRDEAKQIIFEYMDGYEHYVTDQTSDTRTGSAPKSQKTDLTQHTWSDGFEAYNVKQGADGMLLFKGGSLHEGGACFALEPAGGEFYRLQPYPGADFPSSSVGEKGNIVRVRPYGYGVYLVVYNAQDLPVNVLAPIDDLRKTTEQQLADYYLAGEYRTRDGRTITFFPGSAINPKERKVKGLTKDGEAVRYTFGEEYDTPAPIVVLPDGTAYRVEKTDKGLTIRKTTEGEYGWSDEGQVVVRDARRTGFVSAVSWVPGDFPCAVLEPLTTGILSQFTLGELRLMRNEIYARRGLRFAGGGEMQKHFESKDWYHPEADDVSDRLTELDALNIELIRREEKRRTE